MKRVVVIALLLLGITVWVSGGEVVQNGSSMLRISGVEVARSGEVIVASAGRSSVLIYSRDGGELLRTVSLPSVPTGVAVWGSKIFATTFDQGVGGVHQVDLVSGCVEQSVWAPSGACAPEVADGRLYVMGSFAAVVVQYDLSTLALLRSVKVLREPSAAVAVGGRLFVANALPDMASNRDFVSAEVSIIDIESFKVVRNVKLSNGSNALRSMLLTDDQKYILISHNLGRYTVPTTQLQQGWMNTSALSVIDAVSGDFIGSVIVDEPNRGAAGTWGLAQSGGKIIVSHSGTHDLSVIDYPQMIARLRGYGAPIEQLAYDLRFLYGIRQRVPVGGNGPRSIAVCADGRICIPTYFSDTLNFLTLGRNSIESIALNPLGQESLAQQGERIFNDASYCFQNWQSCNGCHPADGRTDGMNWDLINDGIGNPKNCKSLLYSIQTPPSMISGIRSSAELANRKGFVHIQFHNISESEALLVDHYVRSLEGVPSPYLVDGKLSQRAERGRQVYLKLGCADCHSGPYYTDLKMYRIGQDIEFDRGWDTPTLREVWRTAPYLFDGRAKTMKEVFSTYRHGVDRVISDRQIDELVEYVNSL